MKVAKFEARNIEEWVFLWQFEFWENIKNLYGNIAGEQELLISNLFPYKSL